MLQGVAGNLSELAELLGIQLQLFATLKPCFRGLFDIQLIDIIW
jgi:hypothetical protein